LTVTGGLHEACKVLSPYGANERTVGKRRYNKKQFLVMICINVGNT
jgi:hypothetical protein